MDTLDFTCNDKIKYSYPYYPSQSEVDDKFANKIEI